MENFKKIKEKTRVVWHQDTRDEKIVSGAVAVIDRVNPHRSAKKTLLISWGLNLAIWAFIVIFPKFVYDTYQTISISKYGMAVIAIPFVCALFGTYALLKYKFPDIEETKFESDLMSSYDYQTQSAKRWKVWVVSTAVASINTVLLMLADSYLADAL